MYLRYCRHGTLQTHRLPTLLNIEAEVHDVAVLNDVVLALDAKFSGLTDSSFRAVLDVVVILDHLGADEAFLKVGVDHAGALGCFPTFVVGPCLHLHLSGRDEGLEIEQMVGFVDETIDTAFLETEIVEEELFSS